MARPRIVTSNGTLLGLQRKSLRWGKGQKTATRTAGSSHSLYGQGKKTDPGVFPRPYRLVPIAGHKIVLVSI